MRHRQTQPRESENLTLENMSDLYWPTRKDQIFKQFAADAPRTDHQNLAVPDIGLKFLSENSVNLRHDTVSGSPFWSNLLQTLKLTQIFHNLFFFRATTSSSFTSSVVPGPGKASLAQQTTTTTTKCWYNAKIDRKMALAQRWWIWRLSTLFRFANVLKMCEIDRKSQLR